MLNGLTNVDYYLHIDKDAEAGILDLSEDKGMGIGRKGEEPVAWQIKR